MGGLEKLRAFLDLSPLGSMKNTTTAGQASVEALQKNESYEAYEMQRAMQKDYMDNVILAAKSVSWDKPYYVCVQCRKERLLENVIRNQFYARRTRPAPDYNLSLFSYDPKTEQLKFEWIIPDPDTCVYLISKKNELPSDHLFLVEMIEKFSDGTLI